MLDISSYSILCNWSSLYGKEISNFLVYLFLVYGLVTRFKVYKNILNNNYSMLNGYTVFGSVLAMSKAFIGNSQGCRLYIEIGLFAGWIIFFVLVRVFEGTC